MCYFISSGNLSSGHTVILLIITALCCLTVRENIIIILTSFRIILIHTTVRECHIFWQHCRNVKNCSSSNGLLRLTTVNLH